MRIHILGICGTFMGGLALIARQMGFEVSGSDENIYPPMSTVLRSMGIHIQEGFDPAHLKPAPDCVIVGNALSRGNPAIEYLLNKNIRYTSGPQWLAEQVLANRKVIAVAGTHGKTTTSSMLAWILSQANLNPGFLIGGVPRNFEKTAELGQSPYFVIEADEYDTAFFDKRSKFLHYRPRILIINNLEYDHADIFPNLAAIQLQFQYLLRTVPGCGSLIVPSKDAVIEEVIQRGNWSNIISIGNPNGAWQARNAADDGSRFELWHRDQKLGVIEWELLGQHNIQNALAAIAAAHEAGVTADRAIISLRKFKGVKRRLETFGQVRDITIYDDFAHHPTAIMTTLKGLRAKVKKERIYAVVQFGSNTMKMGVNREVLTASLNDADKVILLRPNWDASYLLGDLGVKGLIFDNVPEIIHHLTKELKPKDHVLIMSNKGFEGIHQKLLDKLNAGI